MVAMSLAESVKNYFLVRRFGFVSLFVAELPVWFSWMATFPLVFALARRFPLAGHGWPRRLPIHLFASLLAPILQLTLADLVRAGTAWIVLSSGMPLNDSNRRAYEFTLRLGESIPYLVQRYYAFPMLLYFAAVSIHHAMVYYRAFDVNRARQSELKAALARSQLAALKLQLQPHFLFNTLNTVSALVTRDPSTARQIVIRLSNLLRYSLREDGDESTLDDELAFLHEYLDIQKARFRDKLCVVFEIDDDVRSLRVPRMVLQPILENAMQHGQPVEGRSVIHVGAHRAGERLLLTVADNGTGFSVSQRPTPGIGLRNTRERLEHLYRDQSRFQAITVDGKGTRIEIEIPAHA